MSILSSNVSIVLAYPESIFYILTHCDTFRVAPESDGPCSAMKYLKLACQVVEVKANVNCLYITSTRFCCSLGRVSGHCRSENSKISYPESISGDWDWPLVLRKFFLSHDFACARNIHSTET